MIKLVSRADAIPRTTTREEWRAIYRWKRTMERKLYEEEKKRLENLVIYGTSHPELLERYMDQAINPPVMFYPPFP